MVLRSQVSIKLWVGHASFVHSAGWRIEYEYSLFRLIRLAWRERKPRGKTARANSWGREASSPRIPHGLFFSPFDKVLFIWSDHVSRIPLSQIYFSIWRTNKALSSYRFNITYTDEPQIEIFCFVSPVPPYRGSALGATTICAHGTRRGLLWSYTPLAVK